MDFRKQINDFVNRRLFPAQYVQAEPDSSKRISIFQSRVVMLAIAGAVTASHPTLERAFDSGLSRKDLYQLLRNFGVVAGVLAYRYSFDDTKYFTPPWLPGANKGDAK